MAPRSAEGRERAGFATQAYCETREVYLCAIPEACLGGRSAFEYWHTKVKLGKHGNMAGADEAAASQAAAPRSRPSTSTDSRLKR